LGHVELIVNMRATVTFLLH